MTTVTAEHHCRASLDSTSCEYALRSFSLRKLSYIKVQACGGAHNERHFRTDIYSPSHLPSHNLIRPQAPKRLKSAPAGRQVHTHKQACPNVSFSQPDPSRWWCWDDDDDDPVRTGPSPTECGRSSPVWLCPYPETPPKPPYPSRTMPAPLGFKIWRRGGQLADDLQGQRG